MKDYRNTVTIEYWGTRYRIAFICDDDYQRSYAQCLDTENAPAIPLFNFVGKDLEFINLAWTKLAKRYRVRYPEIATQFELSLPKLENVNEIKKAPFNYAVRLWELFTVAKVALEPAGKMDDLDRDDVDVLTYIAVSRATSDARGRLRNWLDVYFVPFFWHKSSIPEQYQKTHIGVTHLAVEDSRFTRNRIGEVEAAIVTSRMEVMKLKDC